MLKKWGDYDPEDTPVLISKEQFGPKTFNDRRNCLFKFFGWLVRKGKLAYAPAKHTIVLKFIHFHPVQDIHQGRNGLEIYYLFWPLVCRLSPCCRVPTNNAFGR
ncbi:hypothetical protein OCK74_03475 [Chitinophagaceae bacterium LB-8]|uniref:Uncharacterized protein n=1 Tax=Paraflavisolibacter caeni TaxID=2982496 RepID=A0A9X2XTA1_9BACT|nr:hypothetical protein [Paraflavisolibacter caeni]MCU7548155.1 hypothetical protein [Paraflavisolibacter caeni]